MCECVSVRGCIIFSAPNKELYGLYFSPLPEVKLVISMGQVAMLLFRQFQFAHSRSEAAWILSLGLLDALLNSLQALLEDHRGLLNAVWSKKPTYSTKLVFYNIIQCPHL